MLRKVLPLLAVALLLSGLAVSLTAEDSSTDAAMSEADRAALVAELVEMSKDQRRAELKKLSAEQRKGLWFEVKKTLRQNQSPPAKGTGAYQGPPGINISTTQQLAGGMVGTIAYDSGFASTAFGGGQLVGNRFDTHRNDGNVNPVSNPGTVSTIRAMVVPGPGLTTSSAGFVLYGPQTGMGGATAIFSTFTTATGAIDSVVFSGLGVTNLTGSEFFALFGDFSSSYIPVFGTGTTMGQGHHGVVGYTGGMGPDIASTFAFTGLNAFVRATGVLVPVELMSFQVD